MLKKFGIVMASLAATSIASASTWDLARDFSITNNPNGAWTYGWSTAVGGTVTPYKANYTDVTNGGYYGDRGAFTYWGGPTRLSNNAYVPEVGYFYGQPGYDVTMCGIAPNYCPAFKQKVGGIMMHPYLGQQAVVRWKAPIAGTYFIAAIFYNLDIQGGATTIVSVVKSGTVIYQQKMSGNTGLKHYAAPETGIALTAGATIDFVVDCNGNYGNDSTGVDAIIKNIDPKL